tara:strand:+ start:701 stop:3223 length:2523 start_codon:yes stop_codon:yes gene_type:complete
MKTVTNFEDVHSLLSSKRPAIILLHWTPPLNEEELVSFKTKIDAEVELRFSIFEDSFEKYVKKCKHQPVLVTSSLIRTSHDLIQTCENYQESEEHISRPSIVIHKGLNHSPIFVPYSTQGESYDDILNWYLNVLQMIYESEDKTMANESQQFNEMDHYKHMADIEPEDVKAIVIVPPNQKFPKEPKYKTDEIRQKDVAWLTSYLAWKHTRNDKGILFFDTQIPERYDYPQATDDTNQAFLPGIGWVSGLTVLRTMLNYLEPEPEKDKLYYAKLAMVEAQEFLGLVIAVDKFGVLSFDEAENKHLNYVKVETKATKLRLLMERYCSSKFKKILHCVALCLAHGMLHRPERFVSFNSLKRNDNILLYNLIAENLSDTVCIYICFHRLTFSYKPLDSETALPDIPKPTLNDIRLNRNFQTYPLNSMHLDSKQPYTSQSVSSAYKQYAVSSVPRKGGYSSGIFDKASWVPLAPAFTVEFPINGLILPTNHKGTKSTQLVCSQNSHVGMINSIAPAIKYMTFKNLGLKTPKKVLLDYAKGTGPIKACFCPDTDGVVEVAVGVVKEKNGGLPVIFPLGDGQQKQFVKNIIPAYDENGKVIIKGEKNLAHRLYKDKSFNHKRVLFHLSTNSRLDGFKKSVKDLIFTFKNKFVFLTNCAKVGSKNIATVDYEIDVYCSENIIRFNEIRLALQVVNGYPADLSPELDVYRDKDHPVQAAGIFLDEMDVPWDVEGLRKYIFGLLAITEREWRNEALETKERKNKVIKWNEQVDKNHQKFISELWSVEMPSNRGKPPALIAIFVYVHCMHSIGFKCSDMYLDGYGCMFATLMKRYCPAYNTTMKISRGLHN